MDSSIYPRAGVTTSSAERGPTFLRMSRSRPKSRLPLPGHTGDHKYYWSSFAATTPLARLVELAHRRPAVERGYEDGKGFTGLDEYARKQYLMLMHRLTLVHGTMPNLGCY